MEAIAQAVQGIAVLSALAAAMELMLPDGAAKNGLETLFGLAMALAIARLLPGISG